MVVFANGVARDFKMIGEFLGRSVVVVFGKDNRSLGVFEKQLRVFFVPQMFVKVCHVAVITVFEPLLVEVHGFLELEVGEFAVVEAEGLGGEILDLGFQGWLEHGQLCHCEEPVRATKQSIFKSKIASLTAFARNDTIAMTQFVEF